ncbi:MAG: cyanophycin synthetase, partial [Bacteroidota bacterium]|nr:cyanophycin synthetase [Bacteroidota bacterium]
LGPMRPEAQSELLAAALRSSSEVHFARDLEGEASDHLHEEASFVTRQNLSTALATLKVLQARDWAISKEAIQSGLSDYAAITGQRGRWQEVTVPGQPLVILDGAHNMDGVAAMVQALEVKVQVRKGKLWVIWGAVADKDHREVMSLLPDNASYVWCAADIPRAMEASKVASLRPALSGAVVSVPVEALVYAMDAAGENDVIWVGGSLFVVGDVLRDAPQQIPGWSV